MKAILVFTLLVLLLLLPFALANGDDDHHGMMGEWGGMWGEMWGGLFTWLLIVLGGFFLLILFFFLVQSQQTRESPVKDDLRIAKQRLAKGEISSEEFDEIKMRL